VMAVASNRLPGMKFPRSSIRHCDQYNTGAKDENYARALQQEIHGIRPYHARATQKL